MPLFLPRVLRTPHFTGRDSLLLQIHATLTRDTGTTASPALVLSGPAGVGKTQTTLEYIYRYKRNFAPVIWIDGTNLDSIRRSFYGFAIHLWKHLEDDRLNTTTIYDRLRALLAEDRTAGGRRSRSRAAARSSGQSETIDLNAFDEAVEAYGPPPVQLTIAAEVVLDWLSKPQNNHWLIVFDNVDDIDSFDVREFFPSAPQGNIIITTRIREASRYGFGLIVEELSQNDAIRLLFKSSKMGHDLDERGMYLPRNPLESGLISVVREQSSPGASREIGSSSVSDRASWCIHTRFFSVCCQVSRALRARC